MSTDRAPRCTLSQFVRNDIIVFFAPLLSDRLLLFLVKSLRRIYFFMRKRERRDIEHNIRVSLVGRGEQINRVIENYYANVDWHNLERIILTTSIRRIHKFFDGIVEIKGLDYINHRYDEYRGLILFAPHFGPYSLVFLRKGIPSNYKVCIIVKPTSRSLEYWKLLKNLNRTGNTSIIIPERETTKRIVHELNTGHIVIIFSDRAHFTDMKRNIIVRIFGTKVLTQKGIAVIMKKTRAPVLSMHSVRLNNRLPLKYEIVFENQIFEKDDCSKSVQEIMQILYSRLEEIVKEKPDYWERWKKFEKWKVQNCHLEIALGNNNDQ